MAVSNTATSSNFNTTTFSATDMSNNQRIDGTPAYGFRSSELMVSAPSAGAAAEGSRVVTITATGIANNAFVRHGAFTTRVPFSRMNEALQRVIRQGGRVVNVMVSGENSTPDAPSAPVAASAPASDAASPKGKAKAKARSKQG